MSEKKELKEEDIKKVSGSGAVYNSETENGDNRNRGGAIYNNGDEGNQNNKQ